MHLFPIEASGRVEFGLQGGHDLIPGAVTPPKDIPVIVWFAMGQSAWEYRAIVRQCSVSRTGH